MMIINTAFPAQKNITLFLLILTLLMGCAPADPLPDKAKTAIASPATLSCADPKYHNLNAIDFTPNEAQARLGMGRINTLLVSPQGDTMAVSSSLGIFLYSLDTLTYRWLDVTDTEALNMSFTPDGKFLAAGLADEVIIVWDAQSGKRLCVIEGDQREQVMPPNLRSDKPQEPIIILSRWVDKPTPWLDAVEGWDKQSGETLRGILLALMTYQKNSALLPNGQSLALQDNGILKIFSWDGQAANWLRNLYPKPGAGGIETIAFSPDGKTAAAGIAGDPGITLWDAQSGQQLQTLATDTPVKSVVFSPDGKTLLSGEANGKISVWRVDAWTRQRLLETHTYWVNNLSFTPDGKTMLSTSLDGQMIVWDTAAWKTLHTLPTCCDAVQSVAFSPDGQTLISGLENGLVNVWNVSTKTLLRTVSQKQQRVESVAFAPDGQSIASGGFGFAGMMLVVWDSHSGALRHNFADDIIYDLDYSSDGAMLAAASANDRVVVWDAGSGSLLHTFTDDSGVHTVAFAPDGQNLASGNINGVVKMWNVESGKLQQQFNQGISVNSVAFAPDGKSLASGSLNGEIIVWDIGSGRERRILKDDIPFLPSIESVAFSPNGKILAAGSIVDEVTLWDADTGDKLCTLTGHTDNVLSLAFSPDGKTLASGSSDGSIVLWNIDCATQSPSSQASQFRRFEFSYGGAYHPDGFGAWHITLDENGDFSVAHNISGEITEYGPFTLSEAENDEIWALIDAANIPNLPETFQRPGIPDETAYTFSLTAGSNTHTVEMWVGDADQYAGVRPLVEQFWRLTESYAGQKIE